MRDLSSLIQVAFATRRPVIAVRYGDVPEREDLVAALRAFAPAGVAIDESRTVDDAFQNPDHVVLLLPDNEAEAVKALAAGRDGLEALGRTQPVFLFLLRGGTGDAALRASPHLQSWMQGRDVDRELVESIDVPSERKRFQEEAGATPEEWLARWKAGGLPDIRGLNFLEDDALLTLYTAWGGQAASTLHYSIGLQGTAREDGRSWYVRIDLPEAPDQGRGICSHPLLHCHVGSNPKEPEPAARVPVPWVAPWDALDWILATVDPRLEP